MRSAVLGLRLGARRQQRQGQLLLQAQGQRQGVPVFGGPVFGGPGLAARQPQRRWLASVDTKKGPSDGDGGDGKKNSTNNKKEEEAAPGGAAEEPAPSSLFGRMKAELEKDPKIKETLEELRKSKVGNQTLEEAAADYAKKFGETAESLGSKAGEAAESLGSKAGEAAESVGKRAGDTAEDARKRAEEGGKAFGEHASGAKEASASAGKFLRDLAKELGLGSNGKTEGKATAGGDQQKQGQEKKEKKEGDETDGEKKEQGQEEDKLSRLNAAREKLLGLLPESFGSDDRSWDEAFKAVFGVKPSRARRATAAADAAATEAATAEAEGTEWFEAVHKESGDVYYYNRAGDTVWEKPETGKIIMDAEHEAHEWAESEAAAAAAATAAAATAATEAEAVAEPSFLEMQIAGKVSDMSRLEEEREAASAASDVGALKDLTREIKALRKEIEKLSAQANTTAVVHVEEKKGAWEKFNDDLREAPIIKSIFGLADTEVVRKARDAAEDAREALETSQNPLVYRMYSVYDSVFAETEMGEAIREFRRLDPEFTMETFVEEMEEQVVPTVIKAFLAGDLATIESYCSEGAGAAVKAAIRERQTAGRKMDENILSIGEMHVAAAKVVDKMGPLIVIQCMVQQINCLYDLKGNVVEGNDDEIVGVFYVLALTLEYNEAQAVLQWKIKEFAIGGTTPYI